MNKDNIFGKTEYALYNYKDLDLKIKSIDIDIECLKNDITLKAITYEEKTGPTNAFNSSVENEVIRRDEEVKEQIYRLEKNKLLHKSRKAKIELALNSLTEEERKLVEMRYFSKPTNSWVQIGLALNSDSAQCCRNRTGIINKISEYLFN